MPFFWITFGVILTLLVVGCELSLSWWLRRVLGQPVIDFIKTLVDATNPNSSITVGFIVQNFNIAGLSWYAVMTPDLRTSVSFWACIGTSFGAIFTAKWLDIRDRKTNPPCQ